MNVFSSAPWFWNFIQLIFLAILFVFCFKSVVIHLFVEQGSEAYLPMPPSWPGVLNFRESTVNPFSVPVQVFKYFVGVFLSPSFYSDHLPEFKYVTHLYVLPINSFV